MGKEKKSSVFPVRRIRNSLIIAVALFLFGALLMKNQAYVNMQCASWLANFGFYAAANGFLDSIDVDYDLAYYNKGLYNMADAMYYRGDYQLADDRFSNLGDYADSSDRACECRQKTAEKMIAEGDYKDASALLSQIMYYEGSVELYNECQYRFALDQVATGDWFSGAQMLWGIKDYKDAGNRAKAILLENTGSDNVEETLGSGKPIPPDVMSEYMKVRALRDELRNGCVAVGFYHTVGLKKDGTVLACGSNKFGQCDTSAWKQVVQIAAGGYHTVALLENGTVVACGDNSNGQCNVSKWRNVVQITATDYNTAALLRDGTVVTCGFNKLDEAKGWSGIERVCAGSYGIGGINNSGALFATHPSLKLEGDLLEADMSTSYAVGLTVSGDVIYSSDTPTEWKKAAAVYAGGETVGIIDQEMMPSVYNRRKASFYRLPSKEEAVAMSLGGTHFAVLYADGSVYCAGANEYGQCDTGDWNLN